MPKVDAEGKGKKNKIKKDIELKIEIRK